MHTDFVRSDNTKHNSSTCINEVIYSCTFVYSDNTKHNSSSSTFMSTAA